VYAERGTLTLAIQHDQVMGTISAAGTSLEDTPKPSSYAADLTGEREGSRLFAAITETVGARRFAGRWVDATLGGIDLQQTEDRVTGFYAGGAIRVAGSVRDDWLDFTWHSDHEAQGRGFLRLLPGGGTLVGLRESGPEPAIFQAIVADQQEAQQQGRHETPGDIQARRYLGYDLASQGKCQQAVEQLELVVQYYKKQAEVSADQPMVREEMLVNQSMPLSYLVDCYFTLGNYKILFDRLEDILALEDMLAPEQLWAMRFQHRANRLTRELHHHIELLTTIEEGTKALLEQAQGSGIGVALEPEPNRDGVLLSAVTEGMPAAAAGLMAGDVLVRINGQALAGMPLDQVVALLRGVPGSIVELVVQRAGRNIVSTLVRTPLVKLDAPRRIPIMNGLARLVERAAAWRTSLTVALDGTEELQRRLRELQTDVHSTFKDLRSISVRAHDDMATAVTDAVELGHVMLRATPTLHGYYATALTYLRVAAAGQLVNMAQVAENQRFEVQVSQFLEQDRETSWLERDIYKRQIALLQMLYPLAYELKLYANDIDLLRVEENYKEADARVRRGLEHLPAWIERWRARLVTDTAKIQILNESEKFFRRYVNLLVKFDETPIPLRGRPNDSNEVSERGNTALVASETARARAFLDLLVGSSPTDAQRPDGPLPNPDLLSLATAPPPSLADLKETVKASETTVVEYFVLDDRVLIWVISPTGIIQMRSAPVPRTTLEHDIDRFVKLIERRPEPDLQQETAAMAQAQTELWSLLERFYALLIAPIKALLPRSADAVVTIVPHGHLFRLPFAAFKTSQNGQDHFLVEEHTLVYAPSLGILKHIQHRQRETVLQGQPTLLALVNPTFGTDMVDSEGHPFTQLPKTEQKFDKITRYYTGEKRILTGTAATKDAFRTEAHAYDVIYLATHAEAMETTPRESYMVLADGQLKVIDVAATRLQARLVILGACQTSRGPITGDGVEGLSRFFMAAGTPTLLATLWKVFEEQTFNQSVEFHEHWLRQERSKAAALREAQLQGRWTFPDQIKAWAGFILVGAWR
jgi:CHAT domain-containing protein